MDKKKEAGEKKGERDMTPPGITSSVAQVQSFNRGHGFSIDSTWTERNRRVLLADAQAGRSGWKRPPFPFYFGIRLLGDSISDGQ